MHCKIAEPKSVEELVAMYQKKQLGLKQTVGVAGCSGVTKQSKKQKGKTNMYSVGINISIYRLYTMLLCMEMAEGYTPHYIIHSVIEWPEQDA